MNFLHRKYFTREIFQTNYLQSKILYKQKNSVREFFPSFDNKRLSIHWARTFNRLIKFIMGQARRQGFDGSGQLLSQGDFTLMTSWCNLRGDGNKLVSWTYFILRIIIKDAPRSQKDDW